MFGVVTPAALTTGRSGARGGRRDGMSRSVQMTFKRGGVEVRSRQPPTPQVVAAGSAPRFGKSAEARSALIMLNTKVVREKEKRPSGAGLPNWRW